MLLTISIVNWNTTELLRAALRAVFDNSPDAKLEVIVVDNASSDFDEAAIASEFPQVKIITNRTNEGYARGNNQVIEASTGDYVLLLNPDTEVRSGALQALIDFMEAHPDAAAAGARLVRPDGSTDQCCRGFPAPFALAGEYLGLAKLLPNCRLCGAYRMTFFKFDRAAEVDQVMGSCMIMSRKAIEEIGNFDENFPIFFNEVDWCFRAKQAGWKIYFTPDAEVLHLGGQSTKQVKSQMRVESMRSLRLFYEKHYKGRIFAPVYWLMVFGIYLNTRLIRRQGKELRD
ncbi:MAG: glycosyltransferase family 2 protein [Armatimonadota bacterium]|nr:glycosyltransferase family 2 protein [Armatimonadota bacterium]